jgi:two-component system, sensor histidine kinase and response regulator
MSVNAPALNESIKSRAEKLFSEHDQQVSRKIDRLFAVLMLLEWAGGIVTAIVWSPRVWAGTYSDVHIHLEMAFWLGLAMISLPIFLVWWQPGKVITRHIVAAGQLMLTALLIHLSGGRIETHFLVFGSLAFLAFYRDWPVLITGSVVVVLDHLLRGLIMPQSVYGVATAQPWRFIEHAAWVCFADVFFIMSCISGKREMRDIALTRSELEATNEIIEKEVIARTAEVNANEQRFRTLCSSAPVTIFETDSGGSWTYASNRWNELTGLNIQSALGHHWQDIIDPEDRPRVVSSWLAAVNEATDWTHEFRVNFQDRPTRWVRVMATACRSGTEDDNGKTQFIGTLEDITKPKEHEDQSKRMLLLQQREDFMAMLTHDLKIPIVGANRILSLMIEGIIGPLSKKQLSLLEQLLDSNSVLLRNIQNLVETYRFEQGGENFYMQRVDLSKLVQTCVDEMRGSLQRKELDISVEFESEETFVCGDQNALSRIMQNLLDNAIKFTPENGQVSVSVTCSGDQRILRVKNSGSYIPLETRQKLFQRYSQGEEGRKYTGGSGLGLYVCRQIAEAHNGSIVCESYHNEGTIFVVTLPAMAATTDGEVREPEKQSLIS